MSTPPSPMDTADLRELISVYRTLPKEAPCPMSAHVVAAMTAKLLAALDAADAKIKRLTDRHAEQLAKEKKKTEKALQDCKYADQACSAFTSGKSAWMRQ